MNYAGDVSCKECFSALNEHAAAQLVDVRSAAEWNFVGVPDLMQLEKQVLLVEWQVFPAMEVDPDFANKTIAQLDALGGFQRYTDLFPVPFRRTQPVCCIRFDCRRLYQFV